MRDSVPSRTRPLVNYALIAACLLAFLMQLADQSDGNADLIDYFGMIPKRVFDPDAEISRARQVARQDKTGRVVEVQEVVTSAPEPRLSPWLTLFTCIFLHGSWMHFLGNMWFLYIFGDNVEDRIGHLGYLVFYLLSGAVASASHLLSAPSSEIPTIGASGAIASVMGAYLLLYPKANVVAIIPIVVIMEVVVLPAPVFLGFWFALQFFQGVWSISSVQTTGVAWWAHIGGFVMGFVVAAVLRAVGETRPPVEISRPNSDRVQAYRYRR